MHLSYNPLDTYNTYKTEDLFVDAVKAHLFPMNKLKPHDTSFLDKTLKPFQAKSCHNGTMVLCERCEWLHTGNDKDPDDLPLAAVHCIFAVDLTGRLKKLQEHAAARQTHSRRRSLPRQARRLPALPSQAPSPPAAPPPGPAGLSTAAGRPWRRPVRPHKAPHFPATLHHRIPATARTHRAASRTGPQ